MMFNSKLREMRERNEDHFKAAGATRNRECDCEGVEHDTDCREHPEYDPTPWCSGCGARRKSDCHCGPLDPMD